MKGLLISMISHEIRAPLTVIQGAADLIAKCYGKISNDELESYICTIVKSVSRAAKTIDKILVLSQVQNDQLIFRPNDGDVVDLCREIISDMIDLNGERKIAIKLSRNFPKVLSFDPVLLRHVISNLLSNAIKYSPKDSLIEIFLSYNGSALEIKIRDHGVGIPNDEMKNVFKLFSRGSNVSKIGGLGIGMFIVKRCVLLQGGKLDVKSKEGEGTTFRVTLPITKNDLDGK
jgi:signal transduction histidine kinase